MASTYIMPKTMLRPSRRSRFNLNQQVATSGNELFSGQGRDTPNNLQINTFNTFYRAPVGRENWAIKHIKPQQQRSSSMINAPTKEAHVNRRADRY